MNVVAPSCRPSRTRSPTCSSSATSAATLTLCTAPVSGSSSPTSTPISPEALMLTTTNGPPEGQSASISPMSSLLDPVVLRLVFPLARRIHVALAVACLQRLVESAADLVLVPAAKTAGLLRPFRRQRLRIRLLHFPAILLHQAARFAIPVL